MCRCSELNVAGFVRLQRLVGQEVAASLLPVRASGHGQHLTAVVVRGWSGIPKAPRSTRPTSGSLLVGTGNASSEAPSARTQTQRSSADSCPVGHRSGEARHRHSHRCRAVMVVVARPPLRGLAAQRPGRSAATAAPPGWSMVPRSRGGAGAAGTVATQGERRATVDRPSTAATAGSAATPRYRQ
jgi:hypothetical protein